MINKNKLFIWVTLPLLVYSFPLLLLYLFPGYFYRVFSEPSYLVLHNLVELFSVLVAFSIFGVGWFGSKNTTFSWSRTIAGIFLAVGLVDMMHLLSFPGMPPFVTESSTNKGILFWLAGRSLAAMGVLFILLNNQPGVKKIEKHANVLLVGLLVLIGLLLWAVLRHESALPVMFIPGTGLTLTKKLFEALIALLNLFSVLYLIITSTDRDSQTSMTALLLQVLLLSIFSETIFMAYKSAYDSYNLLGHIYKVLAYILLYRAVFVVAISRPYSILSQAMSELEAAKVDLERSNEKFTKAFRLIPDAVAITTREHAQILDVNDGFEKVFGYSSRDVIGRTTVDLELWGDPAVREQFLAKIAQTGEIHHFQAKFTRKDGVIIEGMLDSRYIDIDGQPSMLTMIRDISEQTHATFMLERYRDHLEELVEERTQELRTAYLDMESFSYSVSHDLRSPLRAMGGFAQVLLEDYAGALDDHGRQVLNRIIQNSHNMSTLIDDLLAFARISKHQPEFRLVEMNRVVAKVLESMPQADLARYQIGVAPLPKVLGDESMIRQLWVNLLSNAIKYSAPVQNPCIQIDSYPSEEGIVYFIKDNGLGFDMAYVDRLFKVFQRLHPETAIEGTGIGLAIVKRIVDKHTGRVWAIAKPGQGATFYFTLPKSSV